MSRDALLRWQCAQTAEAAERLRFAVDLARSGLHAALIVNGGALVALFTLIGHTGVDMRWLWWSFAGFAVALVLVLSGWLCAHLSQNQFYIAAQFEAWNADAVLDGRAPGCDAPAATSSGTRFMVAGTICATLSIMAFVAGCGCALAGVSG